MSTTTNDKWACPQCNAEMVSIGRREMKMPAIGVNGIVEVSFHPSQYRCPVCQHIAYSGAEMVEQLGARLKTQIAMQVAYSSVRAIDAANRLHNRHNRIRGLWGIVAALSGVVAALSLPDGFSWWLFAMPLLAIFSIVERKTFTSEEVWDEVPDPVSSDETGVM